MQKLEDFVYSKFLFIFSKEILDYSQKKLYYKNVFEIKSKGEFMKDTYATPLSR